MPFVFSMSNIMCVRENFFYSATVSWDSCMGGVGTGTSSGISTDIITSKISSAPLTPPGILIKYSSGYPTLCVSAFWPCFFLSSKRISVCCGLTCSSAGYLFNCVYWLLLWFLTSVSVSSVPEFPFGSLPDLQCHFVLVAGSHIKSLASILLCIVGRAVL